MPNQQMIDSWNRGQSQYAQARHYTPGLQRTQYRTTERGRPAPMNLLVVVHNDVPPADQAMQRVDLIVDSGSYDRAAEHANGHLVNMYDEQAGITDHTALYSDADMARIHRASGRPVEMSDRDGGPPGAQIYSVQASVRQNGRGELVIDTAAPMQPGSGASRYSLHDVQEGMARAAQRDLGLQAGPARGAQQQRTTRQEYIDRQRELMPDLDHSRPQAQQPQAGGVLAHGTGLIAEQRAHHAQESARRGGQAAPPPRGVSSQAGLAAARRPVRRVPSSPAPGQPGSRFNPNVVERRPRPQAPAAPGVVTSADAPKAQPSSSEQKQVRKAERRVGAQLDRKMAVDGIKGGVQGGKLGAKAGSAVPGLGTPAGTAIGAGVGASTSMSKTAIEAGDSKRAFRAAMPVGGVAGGAVAAKLASNQRAKQDAAPAAPGQEAPAPAEATRPTAGERFKESRLGQTVQSEGFKSGAKRVGTETARHAARGADRAKSLGAEAKGVAAGASKGAATGFVQGVRAEMAGRDGSKPAAAGMVSGVGRTAADQKGREQAQAESDAQRPVHETYDYQF